MRIRLEILGTAPLATEGTYVYDSGEIAGQQARQVIESIVAYLLRSLLELGAISLNDGGVRS